ncbi:mannose-6-phosphate isomerase [Annulohypoxylon maeteangense]|uniref:mannose-6-phosphate isomerase n=1 Tax=Annulohypoxylon maeteangense TaxID=1927788 RepID=UPI0020073C03|nr:mannose-6-phosphate isomerase [Annulohypoxylon maeteangense]KAI0879924.1 mannose-6-phosphate isomerase [Annulohypoxylon maeteangense]
MVLPVPLIRLQCGVNSYDWGKIGSDSAAAKFAAATPSDTLSIQSDKPYAELWMGTHPSNPSKDLQSGRTLLELVEENQMLLAPSVRARYGTKLPFLFKVLSINKALSIQAHPNKKLAEKLHARDPRNYPDDNHKPEMAIAITDFEGLCGFRPLAEIAHFLSSVSALRQLVGEDAAKSFIDTVRGQESDNSSESTTQNKRALQSAFAALMNSSQEDVASASKALVSEAETKGDGFADGGVESTNGAVLTELVTRLNKQFPDDIGLFVLFFLNFVKLSPGEALFLKADDIHAYVSGDIIECMAASDNVVRAGFTPKFKDVQTLVDLLTYNYAPIEEQKMEPTEYPYVVLNRAAYSSGSEANLYDPPIDEFSVIRTVLNGDGSKATFDPLDGPSIVICTGGKGKITVGSKTEEIKEGYVFFVGATAELILESQGGSNDSLTTFKAFCEVEDHSNGASL